jgi:rRNA pseudouridine-1189 N-methylase Emg1 (Nep1/Mra1 family)
MHTYIHTYRGRVIIMEPGVRFLGTVVLHEKALRHPENNMQTYIHTYRGHAIIMPSAVPA